MKSTLRVLLLEDDPTDADLVEETLEAAGIGCQFTRIETESELIASLQRGGFEIVLADYTLPAFDGLSALKITRENWPDLPFIFVSGTLGEEVATDALKIGATDYVLKTRLSRLAPSVHRALCESRERAERKRAEDALRRSEAYLATAQRLSHTGSFGWNVDKGEIFWSDEAFRIFEWQPVPTVTMDMVLERTHPEDRAAVKELVDRVSTGKTAFDFEHRLLLPEGAVKHLRVMGQPSRSEAGGFEFVGAVTDITEHKRAEEILKREFNVRLEERVGERMRIARELHDTLLQSFQGLLLKFQAVSFMLQDRPDARNTLEDAIEQARAAIVEGRDAVEGLRSSTLVSADLAPAIGTLGEELRISQNGRGADFLLQVEGTPRDLAAHLPDEVYRIAGEALRNAFRHAGARRIELEIRYDQCEFRVRVRDDGSGIGAKVPAGRVLPGHYGLAGMEERAKLVGGKLVISSEPDSGTEVELTIPSLLAYANSSEAVQPMRSSTGNA